MKFKGTLWMLLVLVAFSVYYFLIELPQEKKQQEEKKRSETVLQFEDNALVEFTYSQKDNSFHLKRSGPDSWDLTQPVQAKGDTLAFLDYLAELQILKITRVVEESASDLSKYGLKDPSLKFTLKFKDQSTKTLLIGDQSPLGHDLYGMLEGGQSRVLLISAFRDSLERKVYDLRDKTLLQFKVGEVQLIQLTRKDETFKLQHNDQGWKFADEAGLKSDADEVQNFLHSVLRGQPKAFIDEQPVSLSKYGLDKPQIRLVVKLKSATEEKEETLLIGSKKEDEGYYAKSNAPNVVLVSDKLFETLSKRSVTFLDRKLMHLDEKKVTAFSLSNAEEQIKVVRKGDAWNITQPEPTAGDTATVNSLLFDFNEARIKEYIQTEITDPVLFGLKPPKQTFSIEQEGQGVWSLGIGNRTSDGKHVFANRSSDSTVFILEEETVKKIFRSLHDLKDKKLLNFSKDTISRILIEYPEKQFEMVKKGADWNLVKPKSIRNIPAFIGTDALWTLNNLEYAAVVTDPTNDTDSGISTPSLKVSIWDDNEKLAGQVTVGKMQAEDSLVYARVKNRAELFQINKRFLDEIPSELSKFSK
jgi:hypothetical protein